MAFVHESLHLLLLFLFLSTCCLPLISTTDTTTTLTPSTSKPHRLVSKTHHPRYYLNETAIDEMMKYSIMHLARLKGKVTYDYKPCYYDYCEYSWTDQFTYNITHADKSFSSETVDSDIPFFETSDKVYKN
jgi:hypothetical protein